eukprot:5623531-Prorocentrum_lima.AAC.1
MLMTTWQNEWQSPVPWGPTQLRNLAERVAITNSLRADFTPSQSVKIRSRSDGQTMKVRKLRGVGRPERR